MKPSELIRFSPRGSKTFQVKTVNNLIAIKINSWNHVSQSEAPASINPRRLIMVKDNSENQFHRDGSWESLMSEFQEENFNRVD